MEPLICSTGEYTLQRWPRRRHETLRAWDTADRYLLDTLGAPTGGPVLVINDGFGALSVPLAGHGAVLWGDSRLTELALAHNLIAAGLPSGSVTFVPAHAAPAGAFTKVVARFPKSLAFWEDTLLRLRRHLAPGAQVLAGGMIKHTPRRAFELLERVIGPVTTSLGWKKARVATALFDPQRELPPGLPDTSYELEGHGIILQNGPNVFARDHLDLGTRVLLPHVPRGMAGRAVDLGCGNGALALALAARNPELEILGVDISYQAVDSARRNAVAAGLDPARVAFEVADGLSEAPRDSFDVVVCNPPFHQDHTVGDQLAWGMFTQAARGLVAGGRLLIVGNRHLGHERRLERIFGQCQQLEVTDRFTVLEAVRSAVL